jgi:hypothetical protein
MSSTCSTTVWSAPVGLSAHPSTASTATLCATTHWRISRAVSVTGSSLVRKVRTHRPRRPRSNGSLVGEWDASPDALAAFFEEGRAPTPGPSGHPVPSKVSRIWGSAKKTTPLCKSPQTRCVVSRCNPLLGRETWDLRPVVPCTNTVLPFY